MTYTRAVSPSGLKGFKQCPRKWASSYIDGHKEEPGPAARRGTQIHADIELMFKRPSFYPSVLLALKPWNKFLEKLYHMENVVAEGEVAVDADWSPVPFNSPKAFFRGVIDLRIFNENGDCDIIDWKTGRVYPDHVDQANAYVALSPECDKYETAMVYIDQPPLVNTWQYTLKRRDELIETIYEDIVTIRGATEYPENPGNHCRFCHLNWRAGGSCKRAP